MGCCFWRLFLYVRTLGNFIRLYLKLPSEVLPTDVLQLCDLRLSRDKRRVTSSVTVTSSRTTATAVLQFLLEQKVRITEALV